MKNGPCSCESKVQNCVKICGCKFWFLRIITHKVSIITHFAQVKMCNNNVIMCANDVIMVSCYYVLLLIIDLVQDVGKNALSGMPDDVFSGEVYNE